MLTGVSMRSSDALALDLDRRLLGLQRHQLDALEGLADRDGLRRAAVDDQEARLPMVPVSMTDWACANARLRPAAAWGGAPSWQLSRGSC